VLRAGGALPRGAVVDMRMSIEPPHNSTIVRLAPSYSRDAPPSAPSRLLLKLSRLQGAEPSLTNERRQAEVEFYNRVAAAMPDPPLVRCYSALYSPANGAAQLLFDDLSQTHYTIKPGDIIGRPAGEALMRAFAEVHAVWWERPTLGDIAVRPYQDRIDADIADMREWFARFADFLGDQLSSEWRRTYARVLSALPRLLQRLTDGRPLTLIHGDANLSNVLLPRNVARDRALVIDWEFWNICHVGEDLANLMALFWPRDQRQALELHLLRAYHTALVRLGVPNYDWAALWYDYRLAVTTRVLFSPIGFWYGAPSFDAWHHLHCAMQAFEDLDCADLLAISPP
jgi:hypothetical protein